MPSMNCVIYKGNKKPDTYLYIENEDDFERVPQQLLSMLGDLTMVIALELSESRALAQADVIDVMAALDERGFYLQLPAEDKPEH